MNPGISNVGQLSKYFEKSSALSVADIKINFRSGRRASRSRRIIKRKSLRKYYASQDSRAERAEFDAYLFMSRSWTSSTTICDTPSSILSDCNRRNNKPVVQNIRRVSALFLDSCMIE